MREIKFRIWDKHNKLMIQDSGHFYVTADGEVYDVNTDIEFDNDVVLMQYTGLKDMNDVEVYEGDICTIWCGVKQDEPYLVEDMRELYSDLNRDDYYLRITSLEVIGNIYDNPKLLTNKEESE